MATYANGRVPGAALTSVSSGVQLLGGTGAAYRGLVFMAKQADVQLVPAPGVGSGYRSLAVQTLYWNAAHGDRAAAATVGLSGTSTVAVAFPGSSSHGTGTRIDVLVNGSDRPTAAFLELADRYGFSREFGAADPNHLRHDGRTATAGVLMADRYRVIAAYLNGRTLAGPKTGTVESGVRGDYYWTRIQEAGHADGLYPTPAYKVDGVPGKRTYQLEAHYWGMLHG